MRRLIEKIKAILPNLPEPTSEIVVPFPSTACPVHNALKNASAANSTIEVTEETQVRVCVRRMEPEFDTRLFDAPTALPRSAKAALSF